MITNAYLQIIDTEYFDLIETREYFIIIRSRNTGHYWQLLEREANGHRTFLISHRHNATGPYHPQKNKPSVEACCEYIKEHDAFHLERVRLRKEQRLENFKMLQQQNQ